MRGRLSRRGSEKYLLPPGKSISHLAEIESPGGGNISEATPLLHIYFRGGATHSVSGLSLQLDSNGADHTE